MHKKETSGVRLGMLAVLTMLLDTQGLLFSSYAAAATTSLTIKKLAADGTTVLAQKTVDYRWLMNNLTVMGDGSTHYYHQGPVFIDNPDAASEQALRWNSKEDTNIDSKDMGALKGTNIKNICDLIGGMAPGDTLKIKAKDGLSKTFAYKNVYRYSSREGPMVLCWYKDGQYPDSGYTEGMRLVWFADTSTNPWGLRVFGNWDWHEAADSRYWYYYQSGSEKYPTTTGLSIQYVSELIINSTQSAPKGPIAPVAAFYSDVNSGKSPLTVRFTDQSANSPVAWAWDFDNDGKVDSNEMNPSFTYAKEGSYTVKLTVQNAAGSDEEVKLDYVTVGLAASTEAPAARLADTPGTKQPGTEEKQSGLSPYMYVIIIGFVMLVMAAAIRIGFKKKSQ
jgi:hypothetical protein